jgi:hypothetical protein
MKALSFHQPRAEQIILGLKTVDVRTWQVQYRGPLAIHASSKRRDGRCRLLGFDPDALDYGALTGTVELTGIVPLDEATYEALRDEHLLDAPFPGSPCYAWHLADPQRFDAPIPYSGRMRLFNVDLAKADEKGASPAGRPPGRNAYRTAPLPKPDPERPFVLYTIPDPGGGYRVALYQWLPHNGTPDVRSNDFSRSDVRSDDFSRSDVRSDDFSRSSRLASTAMWGIELGGAPLRAVADHLLTALRASGYKATDLARAAGSDDPFYLDELTGVRLALILLAVKPLTRHDRIEAIGQGVQAMGDEEAYYWFSKCSAGPGASRAQKALRILLAGE